MSTPGIDPAWGVPAHKEPRWPASLAATAALGLYLVLPDRLIFGPRWLVPALEASLLVPLVAVNPYHLNRETRALRVMAITLIAVINLVDIGSLGLLVHAVISGAKVASSGSRLIFAAIEIWLTNVLAFALWYWELDRGGPVARGQARRRRPDFLFPQMSTPGATDPGWAPGFTDYLYVSFTNSTAFSPTDTMPLTPWAKLLMLVQSVTALLTVAVVAARAINILH